MATVELPKSPGDPFYTRLNALLDANSFDKFVESRCVRLDAPVWTPVRRGWYFRLLLVGLLEGIDSECGIGGAPAVSLAVCAFLRLPVDEPPPDHLSISRMRRAIDLQSHRAVFTWVQQRLVAAERSGQTVAIDGTMPEANAGHA